MRDFFAKACVSYYLIRSIGFARRNRFEESKKMLDIISNIGRKYLGSMEDFILVNMLNSYVSLKLGIFEESLDSAIISIDYIKANKGRYTDIDREYIQRYSRAVANQAINLGRIQGASYYDDLSDRAPFANRERVDPLLRDLFPVF